MTTSVAGVASLWLLGPVDARLGGARVSLGGPSARMLFVQLALDFGHVVHDDQLVDGLWGEWAPSTADSALRVHMSDARAGARRLGLELDRRHGGYVLEGDLADFDVRELVAAEAVCLRGGAGSHLPQLDHVLALWRGSSLIDLRRRELGARLGAGLDRRRRILLERRFEGMIEVGRASETIASLEVHFREDPLNEHCCGLLAKALYCVGRQTRALEIIAETRKSLAEQLGLDPHDELKDVEWRILSHSISVPAPAQERTVMPPELSVAARGPFFGRHQLIEEIDRIVDAAHGDGRSRVIHLAGESGSGKSRVLAEIATRRVAAGWDCFYGWCEDRIERPMQPFLTAFRSELGSDASLEVDGKVTDRARQALLVDRVRELVRGVAAKRPSMVLLDDFQWADSLTVAFVRRVARTPLAVPVVFALADRSAADSALAAVGVAEFTLHRYADDELAEVAVAHGFGVEWVEAIEAATSGLPLLVHDAVTRGPTELASGAVAARSGQLLLLERWRFLDPQAQRILQGAAVLGSTFTLDDLMSTEGCDADVVLDALDAAYLHNIVMYGPTPVGRYAFTHDLMRSGILDLLRPPQRTALHLRVLKALGNRIGPVSRWEHAVGAWPSIEVEQLAQAAADAAQWLYSALSFVDSIDVIERLYALVGANFDAVRSEVRARLALVEGSSRATQGQMTAARACLAVAADLARRGHHAEVAAAAERAAMALGYRYIEHRAESERLRSQIDLLPAGAFATRFEALHQLADDWVLAGHYDEAERAVVELEDLAVQTGDARHVALLCGVRHLHAHCLGDSDGRRRVADRIRALDPGAHANFVASRVSRIEIMEALHDGRPGDASTNARQLVESSIRVGEPRGEWLGAAALVSEPFLDGRFGDALELASGAFERGSSLGVNGVFPPYQSQLFAIGWMRGDLDQFVDQLARVKVQGPNLPWRAALALALAVSGDLVEASSLLDEDLDSINSVGRHWLGLLGVAFAVEAAWLTQNHHVGAAARSVLSSHVDDHLLLGSGVLDYGPVARYLALAEAMDGMVSTAAERLDHVANDPRSGSIWRDRSVIDRQRIS